MRASPEQKTRATMDRLVTGLATKSAKIRALARAGYARADIARYLGVRYQHVRNVLVHAETKEGEGSASNLPPQVWTQVGADGRVVIPAPYRDLLDVEGGGHVLMTVDGREIRLLSRDAAVRRAQELVARHVPATVSLVDELISERRAEAARENGVGPGRT